MAVVGKILLIILGLLLSLLLLLLFFPISYHILVKKQPEDLKISAKVSWLFGFFRLLFDYPSPKKPIVKVLFFTLAGKEKRITEEFQDAANKPDFESESEPTDKIEKEEQENFKNESSIEPGEPTIESKEESEKESGAGFQTESQKESKIESNIESNIKANNKSNNNKSNKGKKDLRTLYDQARTEFDFYYGLWEREETKALINAFLARLLHILKNLLPRKAKGTLHFGAASPDVTGYVFGGYCVAQALYPKRLFLELEPDFEKEILECELSVKGHFTVFTLLLDGLRVILDKRLWRLNKEIDGHRSGEKKQKTSKTKKKKKK